MVETLWLGSSSSLFIKWEWIFNFRWGWKYCSCWYVKTDSLTALIEWIVKNPKVKPKKFIKGISLLCDTIEEQAKQDGYKMIITFLENDKIKKFMKRRKYKIGDIGLQTFVKSL